MKKSRIDRVLEADETNTKKTPQLLENLHSTALQHFEYTSDMFRLLLKKVDELRDAQDLTLKKIADVLGVSEDELAMRLRENDPTVDQRAQDEFLRLRALRVARL